MNKRQIKKSKPLYLDYYRLKPERDFRGRDERWLDAMFHATRTIFISLLSGNSIQNECIKEYGKGSIVKRAAFLTVFDDIIFNRGELATRISSDTLNSDERKTLIQNMYLAKKYQMYNGCYVNDTPEDESIDQFTWLDLDIEVDQHHGTIRICK